MILERIHGDLRFSRVRPIWSDRAVIVLGGGPSLSLEHFEMVRTARETDRVRVVAVNDAYLLAPWADVVYAADAKWFVWQSIGVEKPKLGLTAQQVRERWARFAGQKCGIEVAAQYLPDSAHVLRLSHAPGLSRDPAALASGRSDGYMGHSGFQALNLAILAGAKLIILLGFDGGPLSGQSHFHGEHPVPTPDDVWPHIRRSFSVIERELSAAGVRVVNCSPASAIENFEKMPLAAALALAEPSRISE